MKLNLIIAAIALLITVTSAQASRTTAKVIVLNQAKIEHMSNFELGLLRDRINNSSAKKIIVKQTDGLQSTYMKKNEGSFAERLVCWLAGQGWNNCVQ
ncbi:MAG: hypothetical protein ISR65_04990 [Bacteriovoracaceae bacterium]|nr:hypothetical protein [Bacteriovoracaceae bacterium]